MGPARGDQMCNPPVGARNMIHQSKIEEMKKSGGQGGCKICTLGYIQNAKNKKESICGRQFLVKHFPTVLIILL